MSAIPAPEEEPFAEPPMLDSESKKHYHSIASLFRKLPAAPGTVFRAVSVAPQSLLLDLKSRAIGQQMTGLYIRGRGAITSATRDLNIANRWLAENTNREFRVGDSNSQNKPKAWPLLLVITQKSGVAIENVVPQFEIQKEILLPASTRYRVMRFEDWQDTPAKVSECLRSPAKFVVYLEEI